MEEKIVYLFNDQKRFNGLKVLTEPNDRNPETGEWIIPENATEAPMNLGYMEHYCIEWNGYYWDYVEDPNNPPPKEAEYVTTEPYVPSLEEVKAQKISEFKMVRDEKEVSPIEVDGHLFDYDDKSRDRLAIARQALEDAGNREASITWTTADNERVELKIDDFAKINSAAALRSNELHVKYNKLKEMVNACLKNEEAEAITWEMAEETAEV